MTVLSKGTIATLFNNPVAIALLSRLRLIKGTAVILFNNTVTTASLPRLCLVFILLVSLSPQPTFATTDKFQRYILTIEPHAMEQDLSPLIAEFGDPTAAKTQALTALNMVIVSVPTRWQLAKGAFCQRAMQVPTIKHCIADFPIRLQQSQRSAALNTELTNYNQCKPWYLDADTCPGISPAYVSYCLSLGYLDADICPVLPSPVNVQAAEAWTYTTGSDDVVVAVFDGGFDFSFPNFADNIWYNTVEVAGQDGIDDDGNGYVDDKYGWDVVADPPDGLPSYRPCLPNELVNIGGYHGTEVAHFIAGTNQGHHVSGVAWQTKLMAVRIAGCAGIAYYTSFAKAVAYVIANKSNGINVRIINYSFDNIPRTLGHLLMFNDAYSALAAHDIIVVSSAGNEGARLPDFQSNAINFINVGGVNRSGEWVYDWHPVHVDLAAPAIDLPVYDGSQDSLIYTISGTSYATPQVAGALALLYAYRPNFNYQQARAALLTSVTVLPSLQGRNATAGTLNLTRMFERLPGLAVDFPDQQRHVMEGSSINLTLRLTHVANVQRPVRVPVTVQVEDSSGAPNAASVSPNRLTLTDDSPSQTLTLRAANRDGNVRRGIFLRLRADDNASSEYAGVTRNIPIEVINRIRANNPPLIAFAAPRNISLMEGESDQLTITATPAPQEDITVRLQFDGNDIEVSPNPMTLRDGQTIITATVTARDDKLAELDEQIGVSLHLADPQAFAQIDEANNQATVTIPVNDLPTIALVAPSNIILMEGESAQLTITATPAPQEDIAVLLQFDNNDLEVSPNPITIRAGQTIITVIVTARDDNLAERDEQLSVRLDLVDPFTLAHIDGAHNQTTITIPANDPPMIAFAAPRNITLMEGESAQLTITATPAPQEDIAIFLQFDNNDIEVSSDLIILRAGQTINTVTVTARDDNLAERDEQIGISLHLADLQVFAHIDGARNQATVTIPANDPPTIAFAAFSNIVLTEGERAQLIITAIPAPQEDIAVRLQFDNNDLSVSPNPVTLRAGQDIITVTVTAKDDNLAERDEQFSIGLHLADPQAFAQIDSARNQATVTILANDLPIIAFARTNADIVEDTTKTILIHARPPPIDDIAVWLIASNRAITSQIRFSPNLIIPKGSRSIRFDVSVEGDDIEQTESANVTLNLTRPEFAFIGSNNTLTINTIDNDTVNSIGWSDNELTLREESTAAITIASHELSSPVTVIAAIEDTSAGSLALTDPLADSAAPTNQLMIRLPAGSARHHLIIAALDDNMVGPGPIHTVRLMLREHQPTNPPTLTVPDIQVTVTPSSMQLRIKVYLEGALN